MTNDFTATKNETTDIIMDHVPVYEDKISILLHLGT